MRVTLVIYSLRGGGAERVMSIMANHWAERGWKVTLLTYDDGAEAPAYTLSGAVDHRHLSIEGASSGVVQAVRSNVRRLVVLRRAIRASGPDAVISFLDVVNVRTILATCGLGVPVVVSEHSDPSRHRIGRVWQALRKWSYRYAASVVVLTPDALRYFPNAIRRKGAVIPNPLEVDVGADLVPVGGRRKIVVAVGRLAEEKGFDRLITGVLDGCRQTSGRVRFPNGAVSPTPYPLPPAPTSPSSSASLPVEFVFERVSDSADS